MFGKIDAFTFAKSVLSCVSFIKKNCNFFLCIFFVHLSFSPAFVCLPGPGMHPLLAVFQAAPIRGGGQAADRQRQILHPSERRQVHRVPQPHKYGPTFWKKKTHKIKYRVKYTQNSLRSVTCCVCVCDDEKPIVLSLPTPCRPASMLKVNPDERLSITELVNQLQEIAAARNVNPKSPVTEVKGRHSFIHCACIRGREAVRTFRRGCP